MIPSTSGHWSAVRQLTVLLVRQQDLSSQIMLVVLTSLVYAPWRRLPCECWDKKASGLPFLEIPERQQIDFPPSQLPLNGNSTLKIVHEWRHDRLISSFTKSKQLSKSHKTSSGNYPWYTSNNVTVLLDNLWHSKADKNNIINKFSWTSTVKFHGQTIIFMVKSHNFFYLFHDQYFYANRIVDLHSIPTDDFIPSFFHSNNSELQLIFKAFVLHFENLCRFFGLENKNSWTVESWSWLFVVSFTSSSLSSFLTWCPWHNTVWSPVQGIQTPKPKWIRAAYNLKKKEVFECVKR